MTLAIIFDSVGAGEWLVLLAVLLVVMGPQRLPSTARKIGQYYSKFRRAADSFKRQIMEMDAELEREVKKSVDDIPDISMPDPPTEPEDVAPSASSEASTAEPVTASASGETSETDDGDQPD